MCSVCDAIVAFQMKEDKVEERKLKEKTKTELIRIIFELKSERDALKQDVYRANEAKKVSEDEAWMYRQLQK